MVTAGAVDRMLPLDFGKAKLLMAGGAFFVDVRFAVAELIALELEEASDTTEETAKRHVFPLTLVGLFGKNAKGRPEEQYHLDKVDDDAFYKQIDDQQGERDPDGGVIQRVDAVATVHEFCKLHSKFTHNKPLFLRRQRLRLFKNELRIIIFPFLNRI